MTSRASPLPCPSAPPGHHAPVAWSGPGHCRCLPRLGAAEEEAKAVEEQVEEEEEEVAPPPPKAGKRGKK